MPMIRVVNPDTGEITLTEFTPPAVDLTPIFKPIPRLDFWTAVYSAFKLKVADVLAALDASSLSDDDKYIAELGVSTAQNYTRYDPSVVSLLQIMGYSVDEADTFWLWAQPS